MAKVLVVYTGDLRARSAITGRLSAHEVSFCTDVEGVCEAVARSNPDVIVTHLGDRWYDKEGSVAGKVMNELDHAGLKVPVVVFTAAYPSGNVRQHLVVDHGVKAIISMADRSPHEMLARAIAKA